MTTGTQPPFDAEATTTELAYSFDGVFSHAEIIDAVARAQNALEPNATVTKFLPVLIKRYATELLCAEAQPRRPSRSCCSSACRTPVAHRWLQLSPLTWHLGVFTSVQQALNPPANSTHSRSKCSPNEASN